MEERGKMCAHTRFARSFSGDLRSSPFHEDVLMCHLRAGIGRNSIWIVLLKDVRWLSLDLRSGQQICVNARTQFKNASVPRDFLFLRDITASRVYMCALHIVVPSFRFHECCHEFDLPERHEMALTLTGWYSGTDVRAEDSQSYSERTSASVWALSEIIEHMIGSAYSV